MMDSLHYQVTYNFGWIINDLAAYVSLELVL